MNFDLLIQGAKIVSSKRIDEGDVGIANGRIAAVGSLSGSKAVRTIFASGLHLLPGAIDTQVHFREPGLEHKEDLESGTRAAVMGGVTTVFEMPNTNPATTTQGALADKLARASGRAWCDYSFFVGATTDNAESLGLLEMLPGTPGIKVFVGSSTGTLLVEHDSDIERVFRHGVRRCPIHAEDEERLRNRKSLLSEHPHAREHPILRDSEAARLATQRVLALSRQTGRPVHVLHVSTMDELPLLADAKREGGRVTCEVTPQHLTFCSNDYERLGTRLQMNPPIRSAEHREAIRRAFATGLFDVLGSDHAPHTLEEKSRPYPASPSGMPGVQTLLPASLRFVNEKVVNLQTIVRLTSEAPAAIYGICGKGLIQEGYDADLVLLDPEAPFEVDQPWLQSKCGWSPYESMTLFGKPVHVFLRGCHVVNDYALTDRPSGIPARFDWK